jgi:hypothetical protein
MKKALMLATAVAFIFLGACKQAEKPQDVAKKFLTSMAKFEWDKAKDLATDSAKTTLDMLAMFTAGQKPQGEPKFEIKDTKIEGDKAIVSYLDDKNEPKELKLVQKDGKWLVDFKKETPPMGETPAPQDSTAVK